MTVWGFMVNALSDLSFYKQIKMDQSATVNYDHLQYMVNYNSMHKDYIVRWQSVPENTKERPLYKPSQDQRKSTALSRAWNFAEQCISIGIHIYKHTLLLMSKMQPQFLEHDLCSFS